MRIEKVRILDFRNIPFLELELCDGPNVIYGENGQGKTNFIEAIWLFTGAKSFRGARDAQMVRFDQPQAALELDFFAAERDQHALVTIDHKRMAVLNEIPLKSASELAGRFCAVVFSPAHLSLIKNGPAEKRRFVDTSICQLKPAYLKVLAQYHRTLEQRNRLLKDVQMESSLFDTLDAWDARLCSLAAQVVQVRRSYLERLSPWAREIYQGISGQREALEFQYRATLGGGEGPPDQERMLQALRAARGEDLRARATTLGPHRDDVEILLDGHSARVYGSQGQQRSCVLALKLAECQLMRQVLGEYPVVLLDDVMSELDLSRRDYLLNSLRDRQLVFTCCDAGDFRTIGRGRGIRIENGRAVEITQF